MSKHFDINYADHESDWKDLTIMRLLAEVTDLEDKIDKAIEYIENYLPYLEMVDYEYEDMNGDIKYVMKEWEGKELLEILKGSDKE